MGESCQKVTVVEWVQVWGYQQIRDLLSIGTRRNLRAGFGLKNLSTSFWYVCTGNSTDGNRGM